MTELRTRGRAQRAATAFVAAVATVGALAMLTGCGGSPAESARQAAPASPGSAKGWDTFASTIKVTNQLPVTVVLKADGLTRTDAEWQDGMQVIDWDDLAANPSMPAPGGLEGVTITPKKFASVSYALPWDFRNGLAQPITPWFGFTLTVLDEDANVLATVPLSQRAPNITDHADWPYQGWGLQSATDPAACTGISVPLTYEDFSGAMVPGTVSVGCTVDLQALNGSNGTYIVLDRAAK